MEWIWEQWQWRGTPHSPKLQHYWNPTIRLFSIISMTLTGLILPFCREAVSVFYSSSQMGLVRRGVLTESEHTRREGGVLPVYRDVVGVFYCRNPLGPSLGGLTPLQRSNRCILLPPPANWARFFCKCHIVCNFKLPRMFSHIFV